MQRNKKSEINFLRNYSSLKPWNIYFLYYTFVFFLIFKCKNIILSNLIQIFRLDKASSKTINKINELFVNEDFFLKNEVVITLFIFGKKESGILKNKIIK